MLNLNIFLGFFSGAGGRRWRGAQAAAEQVAVASQAAAAEQAAVASQVGTQAAARGACGCGGAGRRAAARGACNRTRGAAAGARWRWERATARVGAQVAARRRTGREKGERER